MEPTNQQSLTESHKPGRVLLPSDPAVRLTREQLLLVFGGKDRISAERDLLRLLMQPRGERDAA